MTGVVIGDRYHITGLISAGGVGAVYRAEQMTLIRRAVAVKVLRPEHLVERGRVARFEQEVCITAQLRHPNTIRVLDSGRMEDGRLFLVTELLEGEPLHAALARGPLPELRAVRIARQVVASLREAHGHGLVHRDLKPSNVILEPIGGQEVVKVIDFGMAKLVSFPGITMPMTLCGTPGYMAPEQVLGLRLDQRVDIYALGLLLYECLSGAPPFTGETPLALCLRHVSEEPVRLSARVPELNPTLEALVHALLQKAPERRLQTMAEVDHHLEVIEHALSLFACEVEQDEPAPGPPPVGTAEGSGRLRSLRDLPAPAALEEATFRLELEDQGARRRATHRVAV